MVAVPEAKLLFLEIRNGETFQVEFSALDFQSGEFVWKDLRMKESWWIGLTAGNPETLLLHTFVSGGNPDHKNLIAIDIFSETIRWEVEEFSFYEWDDSVIKGYATKEDIVPALIDVKSGVMTEQKWVPIQVETEISTIRPVLYPEGTPHFETIKRFIEERLNKTLSGGVEYLESGNWIIVSAYFQESGGLANYLQVMTLDGEVKLSEKLGEKLEGLGMDTFFILSGCLFFVKNRQELVAYTLYD